MYKEQHFYIAYICNAIFIHVCSFFSKDLRDFCKSLFLKLVILELKTFNICSLSSGEVNPKVWANSELIWRC